MLAFWTKEHGAGVNELVLGILIALDAIWALGETRASLPSTPTS